MTDQPGMPGPDQPEPTQPIPPYGAPQPPQQAQPPYGQQPGYGQPQYMPPGYGAVDPAAPYGRDPMTGAPYSDKSRTTAGLLQLLLTFLCGICGVGRLYAGHTGIGLVQLLGALVSIPLMFVLIGFPTFFAIWVWALVDGIMMLTGSVRDAAGRPLRP